MCLDDEERMLGLGETCREDEALCRVERCSRCPDSDARDEWVVERDDER